MKELDKAMKLGRNEEGIDRICEHDQIRLFNRLQGHRKIFLQTSDLL